MAAALVALVMLDTALTGWLLRDRQSMRRVVAQLTEIVAQHDHEIEAQHSPAPAVGGGDGGTE